MAKAKTEESAADAADGVVTPAPAEAAAPETLRARVLAQCELGAPNDVIDVTPELAKARADVLDTDPAAVAYAETLNKD